MTSRGPRPTAAGQDGAAEAPPEAETPAGATPAAAAENLADSFLLDTPLDESAAPRRVWAWMDRWDPGTWDMPSHPSRLQRVLAGVALVIVFVMTIYVPFKMLGVI